jgi:hypothetical protein
MAEILTSANQGLATNKKLDEIQLAFLEEDNPVENLLKGIYRYRVVEKPNWQKGKMRGREERTEKKPRGERGELHGACRGAYDGAAAVIAKLTDVKELELWREHVRQNRYTGNQWWISDMIIERLDERIASLNVNDGNVRGTNTSGTYRRD